MNFSVTVGGSSPTKIGVTISAELSEIDFAGRKDRYRFTSPTNGKKRQKSQPIEETRFTHAAWNETPSTYKFGKDATVPHFSQQS